MSNLPETEDQGLEGLAVAAFESRMAKEMEDLIVRHGGRPLVAPSMREVPLTQNKQAFAFFETLQKGGFDILILMTGVGTRTLFATLETQFAKSRVQKAFKHLTLVARGPKAAKALVDYGLKASVTVPEPNTWHEVLGTLDYYKTVRGLNIAVQEYGVPNPELVAGLKERGARTVVSFPVYRWALPENIHPLKDLIESIVQGEAQVALFTSGQQIKNVFEVAKQMGREHHLTDSLAAMVVGSIGSVTTEALKEFEITPDFEPEHPKMGFLVKEASDQSREILEKKTPQQVRVTGPTPQAPPAPMVPLRDCLFLKACRKEAVPRTPIWIMRQAGRYLPGYRQVRAMVSFLDLCKTPELAAEVTVSAQEVLDVDAAILFADILLISEPMGFQLEFVESGGPVIRNPFRSKEDLARLQEVNCPSDLGYVMEAVKIIRSRLKPNIPLIGFAGAPFTLASYLMEGGGSRDYFHTRSILGDVVLWDAFMKSIVTSTISYLNAQIAAGAQAIQLFDSWVGILAPEEFQRLVLPYLKTLIKGIKPGVPIIYFGTQTEPFFPFMKETGANVIGVDWRVDLDKAWKELGNVGIQGNMNPDVLLTDPSTIKVEAERILRLAGGKPGHIFNLGHGILPQTPVENALSLVQTVKEWKN
jgi:uroporphyrinogen decarboxylase